MNVCVHTCARTCLYGVCARECVVCGVWCVCARVCELGANIIYINAL